MDAQPRARERTADVERVSFFSDAVFAIALTLLAVELRLPPGAQVIDGPSLIDALVEMGPQLLSFVLSFFVIVMFWLGHYRTFRLVTEIDNPTLALNTLLLFGVVFLPFPTSILGDYSNIGAAVAFYGLCAGATGLASTALWFVVAELRHHVGLIDPRVVRSRTVMSAIAPMALLAGVPLAFVSTQLAIAVWIAIAPAQAVANRWGNRRLRVPELEAPPPVDPPAE
jgi:TMEM175 potassium channel family protein